MSPAQIRSVRDLGTSHYARVCSSHRELLLFHKKLELNLTARFIVRKLILVAIEKALAPSISSKCERIRPVIEAS